MSKVLPDSNRPDLFLPDSVLSYRLKQQQSHGFTATGSIWRRSEGKVRWRLRAERSFLSDLQQALVPTPSPLFFAYVCGCARARLCVRVCPSLPPYSILPVFTAPLLHTIPFIHLDLTEFFQKSWGLHRKKDIKDTVASFFLPLQSQKLKCQREDIKASLSTNRTHFCSCL